MKTFYEGHDQVYQKRLQDDTIGWDQTEEAYREREAFLSHIFANGNAPRHGKLLEMGCGAGNTPLWYAKKFGFEVSGIDISPTAIDWARKKAATANIDADFHVGSVLDLSPFADETFDLVVDGHCYHCIIGEDRKTFLAEAKRVLKPGGYLLIDTMCGPVLPGLVNGYDESSKIAIVNGIATRYFGLPDEIEAEITDAGFRILNKELFAEEAHKNIYYEAIKD